MAQSKYWIYPIKMVDLSIVFCMFTGGYHQLLIRIQPTRQRWPLCNPKKRGDVPQFRIPDWASIGPAWSFNMGPWHGLIKRNKPPGPRTSQDFTGLHGKIHGDDFFWKFRKVFLDQKIHLGIRSLHHQVHLGTWPKKGPWWWTTPVG